ncbi:MAG: DNA strand exchange inhibitor protein [Phycisphaerae bacterium]|nr:DNA strand exchange inhibitor protein [Phycisphaerae bacterium]
MDSFTLNKIEFDAVREILSGYALTAPGRALARRIRPSRNPETVRRWLEQTSQMVTAIRDVGLPPMAGATDISEALSRAAPGGGGGGEDFAAIAAALRAAGNVRAYLERLPEALGALQSLAGQISRFDGECKAIAAVIDAGGAVRDDASDRLAELRRSIARTTQEVHDVIYGYLRTPEVTKLLQQPTVTLHGDRYVLPVRADNRGRLPGVVHRESNTGATVFVEPTASVELNNRLADLRSDERQEVERLLHGLAVRLHPRHEEIDATMRAVARVDLLAAKAQYAYQQTMTCPEICERGSLEMAQIRHPLLLASATQRDRDEDAAAEAVVPIDVRLGDDFDLLVITGPNTGGKTVALKSVALLVVMAQSGMHIPARRGARLPVFRDVFIDVGDEQSLQQSLSTFGAHIKRIRHILDKCGKASLVLLDELGAGTDPDEGGAIGQAILDELGRRGALGMVTTHLSVLKAYAMTHERVDNASVEFDTRSLRPTYHLRIGTPGESHAITVARRLGLAKRIVDAAERHRDGQNRQFRKALRATGEARQLAERARADATEARLAAEGDQEVYQSKLAELHRLQEEFDTWLATLPDWQPGDEIYVPSLGRTGRLVRLELHKQVAVLDAGHAQIEVPLRELMPDLGQSRVREEIATLRQQVIDQARQTKQARAQAERMRKEYHESLKRQQTRARQFDAWLGRVARMRTGDEVPITRKPGRGTLKTVDLPALKATVATPEGTLELSLQDLFPQTGPFAPSHERKHRTGRSRARRRSDRGNRPVKHRRPDSKAARASREALRRAEPGSEVYVVPFGKRATLVRVEPDRDQAVVQSGVFEMTIGLADLEPVNR